MFRAAFPLADGILWHVQIEGKDRLANVLAFTQGADFLGSKAMNGCQAGFIETAHRLLIHQADFVKVAGRLVNSRFDVTLVTLCFAHRTLLPYICRYRLGFLALRRRGLKTIFSIYSLTC